MGSETDVDNCYIIFCRILYYLCHLISIICNLTLFIFLKLRAVFCQCQVFFFAIFIHLPLFRVTSIIFMLYFQKLLFFSFVYSFKQ